jgi:hypothetical protein
MALHDLAVGGFLEIKNVESTGRTRDDVGSLLRSLGEACSLKECGDSAKRGNVGAGGQIFNKFTTRS